MQVLSSLKTAKTRHPGCKVVRRHGVVYVICKEKNYFRNSFKSYILFNKKVRIFVKTHRFYIKLGKRKHEKII